MKNALRKQSKPRGVSGTLWAKVQRGFWDRSRVEQRAARKKGGIAHE